MAVRPLFSRSWTRPLTVPAKASEEATSRTTRRARAGRRELFSRNVEV